MPTATTSLFRVFRASLFCLTATSALAAPVHLRVNGRVSPLGIDTAKPVFSWQSDSTERNWKQSAYEILVASSAEALRTGHADVWDSGKRMSPESVDVAYSGSALKSQQRCFWAVRVWDAAGAPLMATEPASFEMGLLQPVDWKAQWIRRDDPRELDALQKVQWIWLANADALQVPQGTIAEFRYMLHLAKKPEATDLHVLCAATCTTTVNGVVTGHKKAWTSFDQEEIRDQLKFGDGAVGENTILIRVEVPKNKDAGKTFPSSIAVALRLRKQGSDETWLLSGDDWEGREVNASASWAPVAKLGALKSKAFGVGSDHKTPTNAPDRIISGSSLFRKVFDSRGDLVSARLYITALGSYRAFVNGKQVGNDALTPGFTDFRKRVLYQTYDVTSMVTSGKNAIATMLGAGWHGSPLLWSGVRRFAGPDCVRAQLELTYADGSHKTVATDSSWGASDAPVVASEIYGGETYDARLEQQGWNAAEFRESKRWTSAVVATIDPAMVVTAEPDVPVQPRQTIAPISVKMVGDAQKVAVFDMGQNLVGLVRLHVHGPKGTTVRLRFAERLNPDGTIYTENLRDADATDHYTLAGKGDEKWIPAFTFHGFRYVEVSGYPGTPELTDIQGQVMNSLPAKPAMRLETSSDLLNRMGELGLWGQRGNFISIPTDCPQRDERMGWMGDAGAFWRTGSYNFDIDSFSEKFMQDILDAQSEDGSFANISPNLLDGTQGTPGAPGWSDAGILVPYATWLQYGNRSILEQSWPAMQRFMNFIERTNPTFIRKNELGANYADWLAPDPHTPKDLVATAYWALIAQQMQTMAVALGHDEDAKKYAELYDHILAAYQAQYVHPDGSIEGDTQTVYVVTLAMGLAPKALEANMTDRLVKNIADHQNHLTTGFLGTPYLLPALDKEGRADVAYSLLLNDTYPSWGYMVAKGATTWWERWNGDTGAPGMNSYNHYAFGSVMAWVYRRTAGIDADTSAAGFHHVEIAPQVNSKLSHVHAEYDSVYGTIVTDWKTDANHALHLTVTVPANTTATVRLPGVATMDGKPLAGSDVSTVEIGSGTYQFEATAR